MRTVATMTSLAAWLLFFLWSATGALVLVVGATKPPIPSSSDADDDTTCVPCSFGPETTICIPLMSHRQPPSDSVSKCDPAAATRIPTSGGLWDCLMAGSNGEDCRTNSNGTCVWCAEPVFGLCVTPDVAEKIGNLPIFNCDNLPQGAIITE